MHAPSYSAKLAFANHIMLGPFRHTGLWHQFALAADADGLSCFLESYLNEPLDGSGMCFSVRPDEPVLLNVEKSRIQARHSEDHGNNTLYFLLPVIFHNNGENPQEGYVQAFTFFNNITGLLTSIEVKGAFALLAKWRIAETNWPDPDHIMTQSLLQIHTQAANRGATAEEIKFEPLFEFMAGKDAESIDLWLEQKRDGVFQSALPGNALPENVLPATNKASTASVDTTVFRLKQFYDSKENFKSCYQALVAADIKPAQQGLDAAYNPWFSDAAPELGLLIYDYDSHPIIDRLGLHSREMVIDGVSAHRLYPLGYEFRKGDICELPARTLCSRHNLEDGKNENSNGWA